MEATLPEKLQAGLDYKTLTADPNTYIDTHLQDFYADVVYECKYKSKDLLLTFLFEHKSYVPTYPHLQLLRYMLNIWDQRLKENLPLVPIVSILFYHGNEDWKEKSFIEYFDQAYPSEVRKFLPSFEYILTNLKKEETELIKRKYTKPDLRIGLLVMKYIRSPDLLTHLQDILYGVDELLVDEKGRTNLEMIFVYLYTASKISQREVMEKTKNISAEMNEFADSLAAQLVKKGLVEGIKQGKLEGIKLGKAAGIKEGKAEGIKEGKAEGIKEGKAEGIKEGKAKGIKEGKVAGIKLGKIQILHDNISKMLLKGFQPRLISEVLEVEFTLVKEIEQKLKKEGKLTG